MILDSDNTIKTNTELYTRLVNKASKLLHEIFNKQIYEFFLRSGIGQNLEFRITYGVRKNRGWTWGCTTDEYVIMQNLRKLKFSERRDLINKTIDNMIPKVIGYALRNQLEIEEDLYIVNTGRTRAF